MKLYEVQITAYVAAETRQDAENDVRYGDVVDVSMSRIKVFEPIGGIYEEWMNALPFCRDDDQSDTCRGLMVSQSYFPLVIKG